MKARLFLIIFIFTNLFGQERIYPPYPADEITDIHFISEFEIVFINAGGGIFKSSDGGKTWEQKSLYQNKQLLNISFYDNLNGSILAYGVTSLIPEGLINTSDGGETWEFYDLPVSNTKDMLLLDDDILLRSDGSGNIIRQLNNNNAYDTVYSMPTFTVQEGDFGYVQYPYGYILQLERLPSGQILAVGNNYNAEYYGIIDDSLNTILKSENDGVTWVQIWSGLNNRVKEIDFISDSCGYMLADSLYISTNSGVDWENSCGINSLTRFRDIDAVSKNTLFGVLGSTVFFSANQGVSWKELDVSLEMFDRISFYNSELGFSLGKTLFRTNNSGHSWENINNRFVDDLIELDFVNKDIGYAIGDKDGLYKTTNGGVTWEKNVDSIGIGSGFSRGIVETLEMVTENVGFSCDSFNDRFLKTTDGGVTWQEVGLPNNPDYAWGIYFFNEYFGMISYAGKTVGVDEVDQYYYITNDQGNNWTLINLGVSEDNHAFNEVKFVEPNLLFGKTNKELWLSKDTAKTWELCYSDRTGLIEFDFYDKSFGVIATSYYDNFLTIDGGKTWKSYSKVIGNTPYDFEFLGKNSRGEIVALECGRHGKLLQYNFTPDGEIVFQEQITTGSTLPLYKIEKTFSEGNLHVWVTGSGFNVYYKNYYDEIASIKTVNPNKPYTFTLLQNYPNPFNPTTFIEYTIPDQTTVSLFIYDILGRRVSSLVYKEQNPGKHKVKFDGSNLSSGIYFYTLTADNFTATKKLMLLK